MTERFCFVYSDGVKYLKVNGKVMPDNIALDLLNELADENKQLKYENRLLSEELEQCKAVINKKWSEYLRKKELIE